MMDHAVEYVPGVITVSRNGYDFSYEVTRIQDSDINTGSWS